MDQSLVNRRDVALAFGAIWAAIAVPAEGFAQGAAWTPVALTAGQARILDVAAELIVPTTDTPGARAAGVPQFVDRAVANYCTPADAQANVIDSRNEARVGTAVGVGGSAVVLVFGLVIAVRRPT